VQKASFSLRLEILKYKSELTKTTRMIRVFDRTDSNVVKNEFLGVKGFIIKKTEAITYQESFKHIHLLPYFDVDVRSINLGEKLQEAFSKIYF
jgi:hypothetical protein